MKNIHILPTVGIDRNKGRLFMDSIDHKLVLNCVNPNIDINWVDCEYYNIYITSDEEIKEGEWFLDTVSNTVHKAKLATGVFNTRKKIILTTDQDLIKDGVQAIDDEFLEWFIKNPSCEWVEIINEPYKLPYESGNMYQNHWFDNYKIIILKEEPKQETLEEVAEKYINDDLDLYESLVDGHISYNIGIDLLNKLFIEGAKWQQERMLAFINDEDNHTEGELGNSCIDVQTLVNFIEQFKKK